MSSNPVEFKYFTQEEVKATGISMEKVLEIIEEVFSLHAKNEVILPEKVVVDLGERERGRGNAMPAYVGGEYDILGIKWIPGFPNNPRKYNLPRANGLVILNDSWNGMPLAIMDGTYMSAMRTGAATGVGAKYLARKNSKIVGVIGCGVQAITQMMAMEVALPGLEVVRLYDIDRKKAEKCKNELSQKINLDIEIENSAQKAVEEADVIVTVTTADEPIVKKDWFKRGALFCHVGSYQEEEYDLVKKADKIFVDDWAQVLHRETPVLVKMYKQNMLEEKDINGNIGEVVNGTIPGRENDEERIYYLPIGMGIEDIAVAYEVLQLANQKGLGVTLKLWDEPEFI